MAQQRRVRRVVSTAMARWAMSGTVSGVCAISMTTGRCSRPSASRTTAGE